MPGAALLASPSPSPSPTPTCAAFARTSFTSTASRSFGPRFPFTSSRSPWPALRAQQQDEDYIAYDEKKSVFPAEACEELGGESCDADGVGPEVKGAAAAKQAAADKAGTDREYIDYKETKTVFPGEACDDLGGEFCEPEYQTGVYPERAGAKK